MTKTEVLFSTVLRGGPDGDSGAKLPVEGIGEVVDTYWDTRDPDQLVVLVQIDRATLPREYLYAPNTLVWCFSDEWTA